MEIVKQIKEICVETDNEWFLNHEFPQIALRELAEEQRIDRKSMWIIPDKIGDKIPGFMLIDCCPSLDRYSSDCTHFIEFACVRHQHRKKGILKHMVNQLPREGIIYLEASSNDIENIESVWEKCGFQYDHTNKMLFGSAIIYKKI